MDILKRNLFAFSLSLIFASVLLLADTAKAQYRIGYKSVSTWQQKENMRIDVSIWYPTRREPSEFRLDEYIVLAARNGPVLRVVDEKLAPPFRKERELIREKAENEGKTKWEINQELNKVPLPHKKLPLIMLSHDFGATRYSNHTLALELASQGFIVAMPMHVGDNALKMPLLNSSRALIERSRQASGTLDLLLSHKVFSHYIDDSNITFIGFGSGGTAGLLLTGTALTTSLWQRYCAEFESDISGEILSPFDLSDDHFSKNVLDNSGAGVDPYCREPLKARLDNLVSSLQDYFVYTARTELFYEHVTVERKKIAAETSELIDKQIVRAKAQSRLLAPHIESPPFIQPYFPPLTARQSLRDARFKRMVLVSPGYSILFDREGLSRINKPILFIGLDQDKINIPQYQSKVLFELVTQGYANHEILEGTDIWGLQAPCAEPNMLVEICKSVTDEERSDITSELAEIILDFVPNFEAD